MRITCETKDALPLDALTEFQGGLKQRDDSDYQKIRKSIERYGFATPFFVWKHENANYVLDGHGRLETLKRMQEDGENIPILPVVYVDCKNEADAKNLLLRINSTYGKMTAESVLEFVGTSIELELDEIALPDGILDMELPADSDIGDDKADEIPEEVKIICKRGDIWQIGKHRLMCGDSTNAGDVALLMDGEKADLWLTDPPYNVNYTGKTKDALKIVNDKKSDEQFGAFLTDAYVAADSVMRAGACFYIWYADLQGLNFRLAAKNAGWVVRECLIWNKDSISFGRQDCQWKHEPCLYGWKGGASHYWNSDRKQTTVIDFKGPNRNAEHPTMKPVGLFAYLILNSTKRNDIVLDSFSGSGTTIIACEQKGRKARLMELDEHYCDVIIQRFIDCVGSDKDICLLKDGVAVPYAEAVKERNAQNMMEI